MKRSRVERTCASRGSCHLCVVSTNQGEACVVDLDPMASGSGPYFGQRNSAARVFRRTENSKKSCPNFFPAAFSVCAVRRSHQHV